MLVSWCLGICWGSSLQSEKARTGVWGLDEVLAGGLSQGHIFLVEGHPGTGKTTVALQFLLEGVRAGEKCLYVTLSETERELRDGAASHGWEIDEAGKVVELLPPESRSEERRVGKECRSRWAPDQ